MNGTEEVIGIECCLYADNKETDLTLEGSFHKKMANLFLFIRVFVHKALIEGTKSSINPAMTSLPQSRPLLSTQHTSFSESVQKY